MRFALFKVVTPLIFALFCLGACRSAIHGTAAGGGAVESAPSVAAKHFFKRHYDFYYENPVRCEALITRRLFRALKHHYDEFERTRQISPLDFDPWTGSQDSEVSRPYSFTTLKAGDAEAVVRFEYAFPLGPESRKTQAVFIKFQRSSPGAAWLVSDLIMPNNGSLLGLLEGNP